MTRSSFEHLFARSVAAVLQETTRGNSTDPDKELGTFTKGLLNLVVSDHPDDKLVAGTEAMRWAKHNMTPGKLPFTWRVLHNSMFKAWLEAEQHYNQTEEKEVERALALSLLHYPLFKDPSPERAQWEAAVGTAMQNCADASKLQRLLALVDEKSNRVLVVHAINHLAQTVRDHTLVLGAGCMSALPQEPPVAELIKDVLTGQVATVGEAAKAVLKIDFGQRRLPNEPPHRKVRMVSTDQFEIAWHTSSPPESFAANIKYYEQWLDTAEEVVRKAVGLRTARWYDVSLVVNFVEHQESWGKLAPKFPPIIKSLTRDV